MLLTPRVPLLPASKVSRSTGAEKRVARRQRGLDLHRARIGDMISVETRTCTGAQGGPHGASFASRLCTAAYNKQNGNYNSNETPDMDAASEEFDRLEKYVADLAQDSVAGSTREDWKQVADCWVLMPPQEQQPTSLVLFTGGAVVGAAPQYTYRLLIERLASRGLAVVAVPFRTSLNHTHIAAEVNSKFEQCVEELAGHPDTAALPDLPLYGVGHSLGAVVQLLMSITFSTERAGNILLSFNNEPFGSMLSGMFLPIPFLGRAGVNVNPLLSQLGSSPAKAEIQQAREKLRRDGPEKIEKIVDVLDELEPIFTGLANGNLEFKPPPEKTSEALGTDYDVHQNLIIRFDSDTIDVTESLRLKEILEANPDTERQLSYRGLPGAHLRPVSLTLWCSLMGQQADSLPGWIRPVAERTTNCIEGILGRISGKADKLGFRMAASTVKNLAASLRKVVDGSAMAINDKQLLANEMADWMKTATAAKQTKRVAPSARS